MTIKQKILETGFYIGISLNYYTKIGLRYSELKASESRYVR
jgi:hypothetical protein